MPAEQPTPQEQPDKITDLPQRAETDASGVADQIKGGEGVAKNLKAVGDTQNNLAGALKAWTTDRENLMHSDDGQTHRTKTDAIADLPQSSTNALRVADQIKGGTGNAMKPKGDTEGTISQNTK